jgi:hypothetical protein
MRAIGLTSNVEVSMAYGATIVPWRSIHFPPSLLFSSLSRLGKMEKEFHH